MKRKLAWHEHKGVAYYDRERMRQPLEPIAHPAGWEGWTNPLPSWIDPAWQAPIDDVQATVSGDDPLADTAEYILDRCEVEATAWTDYRTYLYELVFNDLNRIHAEFRFVSRTIAEAALVQLLKIRKAKHPQPRVSKWSPENDCVFFTRKKLADLPADPVIESPAAEPIPVAA